MCSSVLALNASPGGYVQMLRQSSFQIVAPLIHPCYNDLNKSVDFFRVIAQDRMYSGLAFLVRAAWASSGAYQ
jgi:23S rRNA U2552 (ribose-2'-O)-methylase RlmE/FtsJ